MESLTYLPDAKGTPPGRRKFTGKETVGKPINKPISKPDDDAFARVRVILMNGVQSDALRLTHILSRMCTQRDFVASVLHKAVQMGARGK
ncbi:hypothetical protein MB84_28825 (plasmid) [Pandoraea oxalativorans]|uniref:Uncharacterized protein n=1 Tax=Pandoraea oxalativorans TaxID=573737 RepID=A0A0G3IC23_9BURK|nr:hypothetical protein MB84_28825 [Pandoraea oxalativorans]